jgi:hypothetical protein
MKLLLFWAACLSTMILLNVFYQPDPGLPNGMIEPPNDIFKCPRTITASFGIEGRGEVMLNMVHPDGHEMKSKEALDLFHRTGAHLGVFATPEEADAYAQALQHQSVRGGQP